MSIPSYEDLFGLSDYRTSDEYRTVLSPAAYLVDLLLLKDISIMLEDKVNPSDPDIAFDPYDPKNFTDGTFRNVKQIVSRSDDKITSTRSDIYDLKLNRKNTMMIIPYLDIVNNVLETNIIKETTEIDSYESIFDAVYPFNLPQNVYQKYVNQTLDFFKEDIIKFLKLYGFNGNTGWLNVARDYLVLSKKESDILITGSTLDVLAQYWGLDIDPVTPGAVIGALQDPELFKKKAGINNRLLQELLFQDLSIAEREGVLPAAVDDAGIPPVQSQFYINKLTGDDSAFKYHIFIDHEIVGDNDVYTLKRKVFGFNVPEKDQVVDIKVKNLERINRFIRLSKKLEWSFTDLDLVIRNCCSGKLVETDPKLYGNALKIIAVVKYLENRFEVPLDVICALVTDIKTYGKGIEYEDADPSDLFTRLFGDELEKLITKDKTEIQYVLQGALQVNKKDFDILKKLLIETNGQEYNEETADDAFHDLVTTTVEDITPLHNISFIYRVAKCAHLIDVKIDELLRLCEIIDLNRKVNELEVFNVLINSHLDASDSTPSDFPQTKPAVPSTVYLFNTGNQYQAAILTLIQKLCAIVDWLEKREMTVDQFEFVCRRDVDRIVDGTLSKREIVSLYNSIRDEYEEIKFTAKNLENRVVTDEMAVKLFEILAHPRMSMCNEDGVVQNNCEDKDVFEYQIDHLRKSLLNLVDMRRIVEVLDFDKCKFEVIEESEAEDDEEIGVSYQSVEALAKLHCIGVTKPVKFNDVRYCFNEVLFVPNPKPYVTEEEGKNQIHLIDETHRVFFEEEDIPKDETLSNLEIFLEQVMSDEVHESYLEIYPDGTKGDKLSADTWKLIYNQLLSSVTEFRAARGMIESTEEGNAVDEVLNTVGENAERQRDSVIGLLSSEFDTPEKTVEILVDTVYCDPVENAAMGIYRILAPVYAYYSEEGVDKESYPDLGCLHVAFKRLQQFILLVNKSQLKTQEVQVFVDQMKLKGNLPENLKLPDEFLRSVVAAYKEPLGDIVIFAKVKYEDEGGEEKDEIRYAKYAKATHELIEEGNFWRRGVDSGGEEINDCYQDKLGIVDREQHLEMLDAAVTDEKSKKSYLFGTEIEEIDGEDKLIGKYIDVKAGTKNEMFGVWGKVKNNIQELYEIDAAYATNMNIYIFSGDQYYRYTKPESDDDSNDIFYENEYADEGYPLRINHHWNDQEGEKEFTIDSDLIEKIDAIFKGAHGKQIIFSGDKYLTAGEAENAGLLPTKNDWGIIRNNFQMPDAKVTAALISEDKIFLFCKDQYIRYSGEFKLGDPDFYVDEEYPRLISDWNDVEDICQIDEDFFIEKDPENPPNYPEPPEPEQPEKEIDAAFSGVNGKIYFFQNTKYCGSSDSGPLEKGTVNEKWGKVRNNIQENGDVDAAFIPLPQKRYFLGADTSGTSVDKIYPSRLLGDDWVEDVANEYDDPIKMDGEMYENGIGGRPPTVAETFNWLLYDVETFLTEMNLVGEPVVLKGHGGHRDGSGSVDLYIRTSIDEQEPSFDDWKDVQNGVVEQWYCSWQENNKQIYIDLRNVKWIWVGMKTASIDPKDNGVFGELEIIVDPDLEIDEQLFGIPGNTHDDRPNPVSQRGITWTEDEGTDGNDLKMNDVIYPHGIGGKTPSNTYDYNYLVYNIEDIFREAGIDPRQARKTAVEQGVIYREVWTGIPGTEVEDLTNHDDFPIKPHEISTLTSFEAPANWQDHYGTRIYGYIVAPQTGYYTFWIASDDQSKLWLSSNENPAHKKLIASVPSYTQQREWHKYPEQQSEPIFLEAGRSYFIEALHKEGEQDDNLAVGWKMPNDVEEKPIPGSRFKKEYTPAVYLYGYGGHQDGSGSVDLDIKTSNSDNEPSKTDWYNNQNGVLQRWNCSYQENNKRIHLSLENTKWLFIGMKTGSPDTNDHGVFAELKFAAENEKPHREFNLGITATPSPDETIQVADKTASQWVDNKSTNGDPITMNGVEYETGIGGKPRYAVSEFNWVLYNLKEAIEERDVKGKPIRLTGFGGHQDGSGSVDLYVKTSSCTNSPSEEEWISTGDGVVQQWFCRYTETNKEIYVDLNNVRWIWIGMRTGSPDMNDHGVLGDLKITVEVDEREHKTYLFSGNQYFRYDHARFLEPIQLDAPFYLLESYPKVIKDNWNTWEELGEVPETMSDAIRAAFMGIDDKPYLFSNDLYKNLYKSDAPEPINYKWGVINNNFQRFGATIDAMISIPGSPTKTYLFSGDHYVRYSNTDTTHCDAGYPKPISDWKDAEGVAQGFPMSWRSSGMCAALMGNDGKQYYFRNGKYVTDSTYYSEKDLVSGWHTQVNPSIDFDDVTMALTTDTATYLFCREYYIKYTGTINPGDSGFQPEAGYPKTVAGNWTAEGTGIDLGLYNPRYKTAIGYLPDGGTDKIYFFVRDSHVQADLVDPTSVYNRLRFGKRPNKIQDLNRVDAAVTTKICGAYVTYLFCDDEYVRYTHDRTGRIKDYRYIDEGYPKLLADSWDAENCDIDLSETTPKQDGYALLKDLDDRIYHFDYLNFTVSEGTLPSPSPEIRSEWGIVLNYIKMDNCVDAAFVYPDTVDGKTYTYLFRRKQVFRYTSDDSSPLLDYGYVDEGYPKIMTQEKWDIFESHFPQTSWPLDIQVDEGEEWIHAAMYREGSLYIFDRYLVPLEPEDPEVPDATMPKNGYLDILIVGDQKVSPNSDWGIVENFIRDTGFVHAAVMVNDGVYKYTYLFSNTQFVKYTHKYSDLTGEFKYHYIDLSYPRTIETKIYKEFAGLVEDNLKPPFFLAAMSENDDKDVTFFIPNVAPPAGEPDPNEYVKLVLNTGTSTFSIDERDVVRIKWGYVYNRFEGDNLEWEEGVIERSAKTGKIDAAVQLEDGRFAIFVDEQFAIYSNGKKEYVDESFPRRIYGNKDPITPSNEAYVGDPLDIKGNYWGLPPLIEDNGVIAAISLCGRTYFFMNRYLDEVPGSDIVLHYFRYSDPRVKQIDQNFPRLLDKMWAQKPEITANQTDLFWQMKQLSRAYNERENDILTYMMHDFSEDDDQEASKIAALEKITGWLPAQIDFLFSVYLGDLDRDLQHFIPLSFIKLYYDYAETLNSLPKQLKTDISDLIFVENEVYTDYKNAENLLFKLLQSSMPEETWADLSGEYNNLQNIIKRDAMVPYLISLIDRNRGDKIEMLTPRDLYQYLLIDVEMGKEGVTSRMVEALACMQLYYHRKMMQIESDIDGDPATDLLKEWWWWMKNYRVWEANRKVFLYPENYLRPELRQDKSEAFQKLEESLKQNDLDDMSLENSYREYLDDYVEVSTLDIVGGYVYSIAEKEESEDSENEIITEKDVNVIMFGHTRTDPLRYFYRKGERLQIPVENGGTEVKYKTEIDWEPWREIKITIDSKTVYPVYAFNRVFVFWIENEEIDFSNQDQHDDQYKVKRVEPKIFYSFLKMNGEWVQPQEFLNVYAEADKKYLFLITVRETDKEQGDDSKKDIDIDENTSTEDIFEDEITKYEEATLVVANTSYTRNYEGDEEIIVKYQMEYSVDEINRSKKRYFSLNYPGSTPEDEDSFQSKDTYSKAWLLDTKLYKSEAKNRTDKDIYNATFDPDLFFINEKKNVENSYHWKSNVCSVTAPSWFSLTMKGGSFLLKPAENAPIMKNYEIDNKYKKLEELDTYKNCKAERIDAAMRGLDDREYLFTDKTYYHSDTNSDNSFKTETPIHRSFGKMDNLLKEPTTKPIISVSVSPPPTGNTANSEERYVYLFTSYDSDNVEYLRYRHDSENYLNDVAIKLELEIATTDDLVDMIRDGYEQTSDTKESFFLNDMREVFTYPDNNQFYLFSRDKYCLVSRSELVGFLPNTEDEADLRAVFIGKEETEDRSYDALYIVFDDKYYVFDLRSGNNDGFTPKDNLEDLIGSDASFTEVSMAFSGSNDTKHFFHDGKCRLYDKDDGWITENWDVRWGNQSILNYREEGLCTIDAAITINKKTYIFFQNTFIEYEKVNGGFDYGSKEFQKTDVKYIVGDASPDIFKSFIDLLIESGTVDDEGNLREGETTTINTLFLSKKLGEMDPSTVGASQKLYVFSKKFYCCYEKDGGDFVPVEDYEPQAIIDNIGNLPVDMAQGIDASICRYPESGDYYEELVLFVNDEEDDVCFAIEYGRIEGEEGEITEVYQFPYEYNDLSWEIVRLTSHTSQVLSQILFAHGIEELLTVKSQEIRELPVFAKESRYSAIRKDEARSDIIRVRKEKIIEDTLPTDEVHLDFESANKEYYWEIFFHAPFLVAQELNTNQKFKEAKDWFEFIFDPTDPQGDGDKKWWRFYEFRNGSNKDIIADYIDRIQIGRYKDDPFNPHTIAAIREIAYQKATVMAYVDNLLDWGDQLFGMYTRESINEARMLYVLAYDILGKRPENLGEQKIPESASYRDLLSKHKDSAAKEPEEVDLQYTHHSEFIIEYENDPLYPIEVGDEPPTYDAQIDSIMRNNLYFTIPENNKFIEYWDRVEDRLYKIRASLNIFGVKQALPLFQPPIDPFLLISAVSSGLSLDAVLADLAMNAPHYRFTFMMAKAKELASRVVQLGSTMLSTLEKKDAEELSLLRNTHEKNILDMNLSVKEDQLEERKASLDALNYSLSSAKARKTHYTDLLNKGLNDYEKSQLVNLETGQAYQMLSQVFGITQSVMAAIPQIGSPFSLNYGGIQLSGIAGAVSGALGAHAGYYNYLANMSSIMAGHERRREDWQLQKTTASFDVEQIEKQIEASELLIEVARKEIDIQKKMIRQNESIDDFMRSKFTNNELYQWMIGKLAGVYFQTYKLALDYAKAAERAYQYELGIKEPEVNFIKGAYWESLKKGLMSGETLTLDLDRLEKAYIDKNTRRFELTKTFSLYRIAPTQLIKLKNDHMCEFELSQQLYDEDFPGHYCRQIKSVSITFPAVVGPYQNINATLTQVSHKTLMTVDDLSAIAEMKGSSTKSHENIRYDWRANQQIAISRGINDSGLFELRFQDERYLPFEGTGAVSKWRLVLEGLDGVVDISTLADVLVTVNYTSLQGGDKAAKEAKKQFREEVPKYLLVNIAQTFPVEWNQFLKQNEEYDDSPESETPIPSMTLNIPKEMMYLPRTCNSAMIYYEITPAGKNLADSGMILEIDGDSDSPLVLNHLVLMEKLSFSVKNGVEIKMVPEEYDFTSEKIRNIGLVLEYECKYEFNK